MLKANVLSLLLFAPSLLLSSIGLVTWGFSFFWVQITRPRTCFIYLLLYSLGVCSADSNYFCCVSFGKKKRKILTHVINHLNNIVITIAHSLKMGVSRTRKIYCSLSFLNFLKFFLLTLKIGFGFRGKYRGWGDRRMKSKLMSFLQATGSVRAKTLIVGLL